MSSRCGVASCSNDRRYKNKWIVLPHVSELKFHKPNPQDHQKWETKLQRPGYTVSGNTRVCSNHFRYGKPLHNNRAPTMHLRSYPSWARTVSEVRDDLQKIDEEIVCEVLSELCEHAQQQDLKHLFEKYVGHLDCSSGFSSVCMRLEKTVARSLIDLVLNIIPIGKCLEVLAFFTHGIPIEGRKPHGVTKTSGESVNLVTELEAGTEMCQLVGDFHNYVAPMPSDDQNNMPEVSAASSRTPMDTSTSACKPTKKKCMKKRCQKRIRELEAKVTALEREVQTLKKKADLRTRQRNENQQRIRVLQKQVDDHEVQKPSLDINRIKHSDTLVTLHTGLPSYAMFQWVLDEVRPAAETMNYWDGKGDKEGAPERKKCGLRALSIENELLMCLMKLKLNLSGEYLAFLFSVSTSTVSILLSTWIPMLSLELSGLIYWPSREEIKLCYPSCFKKWDGITAVVDCFEIPAERPSHVEANSQVFSTYKNRPTSKFLLACTPGGSISYISCAAGGNMSDKEIFLQSGILQKFSVGDKCMADKGFRVQGELLEHGVELIIPPFVKGGKPFTDAENSSNKNIAHSRIHVERVIGRLRDYSYLNGVTPISQLDLITPAVKTCVALTNLKRSVVNPE